MKSAQKLLKKRRKALFEQMGPGSIGVLFSAPQCTRNGDVHYPYRQNSDFYYLTGFDEPDAVAVFLSQGNSGKFVLFLRERNPKEEQWHGPMVGLAGARKTYGADQAFELSQVDEQLMEWMRSASKLYHALGDTAVQDNRVMRWVEALTHEESVARAGHQRPHEVVDIQPMIHEMRLFKDAHECEVMRTAAAITVKAHEAAMQACRSGAYEYMLEAALLNTFYRHGSRSPAYPSIVGAGNHACTLHYTANNGLLSAGDLVLIDAGAEYAQYAADVTRTFPVSGRFSEPQKAIYNVVLKAQQAVIASIRPGTNWREIEELAARHLTAGLLALGILKGKLDDLLNEKAYRRFFLHRLGHWLGMDVHDVGRYEIDQQWRPFEPGMVMAIEPAIYIPEGMRGVARQWRGIGVRIEDDVLVTEDGCEVLTDGLARTVDEIEALMAEAH